MRYFIDPTIDCVFKKILGAIGREKLLINFLNCVLKPLALITRIVLQNPYNDKDYKEDKLSIVDIKAQDENGVTYQIEVQVATPSFLANRMLCNWSDIYQRQLTEGFGFAQLKPVISIWLLTGTMIKSSASCHHNFEAYDRHNNVLLTDHMSIHVLELGKWRKPDRLQPVDNWLYFFKEGKNFKHLPPELKQLPQMREAMSVLTTFSDQSEDYHRYKARMEALRIQWSEEYLADQQLKQLKDTASQLEQANVKVDQANEKAEQHKVEADQAKAETDQAKAEAEQKDLENERLRALLRQAGLTAD